MWFLSMMSTPCLVAMTLATNALRLSTDAFREVFVSLVQVGVRSVLAIPFQRGSKND
jgi:hypothetical protein